MHIFVFHHDFICTGWLTHPDITRGECWLPSSQGEEIPAVCACVCYLLCWPAQCPQNDEFILPLLCIIFFLYWTRHPSCHLLLLHSSFLSVSLLWPNRYLYSSSSFFCQRNYVISKFKSIKAEEQSVQQSVRQWLILFYNTAMTTCGVKSYRS